MEFKKWEEYTKEEQKELLNHWWHYYGKMIYTLEEWNNFNDLIDKDSNKIMEVAIAGYVYRLTSQPLISAMRENKLEELFNSLPNLSEIKDEKFLIIHEEIKNSLIKKLITTYNKPEPSKPIDTITIINQTTQTLKKKRK